VRLATEAGRGGCDGRNGSRRRRTVQGRGVRRRTQALRRGGRRGRGDPKGSGQRGDGNIKGAPAGGGAASTACSSREGGSKLARAPGTGEWAGRPLSAGTAAAADRGSCRAPLSARAAG
jgi:hypothetical protein